MKHATDKDGLVKWMVCKEGCLSEMSAFAYVSCTRPTEQQFGERRKSRKENLRHDWHISVAEVISTESQEPSLDMTVWSAEHREDVI